MGSQDVKIRGFVWSPKVRAVDDDARLHVRRLGVCPEHGVVGLELLARGNARAQVNGEAGKAVTGRVLKPPLVTSQVITTLLERELRAGLLPRPHLQRKCLTGP